MTQKITPCLWFDKNAEEAMNFYVDIFKSAPGAKGDSNIVSIDRYPDGPLQEPMKGMEGKVITGIFQLQGNKFMCLDGGPTFKPTEAISFQVECADQQEVDHFWDKLGQGGDPKSQQCGWLKDKFGFSWQIVPKALVELLHHPDKEKANKVLQAMMQMKKIEVAKLEEAANS